MDQLVWLRGGKRCLNCGHFALLHTIPVESDEPGQPHMACAFKDARGVVTCDCAACGTYSDEFLAAMPEWLGPPPTDEQLREMLLSGAFYTPYVPAVVTPCTAERA